MAVTIEESDAAQSEAASQSNSQSTGQPKAGLFGELMRDPQKLWRTFWAVALAACLPFFLPYARTLWRQELYQYFPFVLLGVGFLFWTRWDKVFRGPKRVMAWTALWLGVAALLVGALMHSTWVGNLGFVLLLSGFLLSHRSELGGSLGYLALPLVMLIRVPQLHAESLIVRLQKVTSALSSLGLDLLSVPHLLQGNVIRLTSKDLLVAEACSGIKSAFTMCFLALLIVVWRRRPLLSAPVYFVFALVFAILANTFRVMVIALGEAWFQNDLTTGFVHDLIGYVALALGAGVLLSFDALVGMVLNPVHAPADKGGLNPVALAWNWMLGATTDDDGEASAFRETDVAPGKRSTSSAGPPASPWRPAILAGGAALASLLMVGGFLAGRSDSRPIISQEALLFDPPEDFLAGRVGVLAIGDREVVRNGSDPRLGLHADVWMCGTSQSVAQVAMSQPYVGWHELCVCYEAQDWKLDDRYNLNVSSGKPVAVGEFSQEGSGYGYLIFTAIDTDGTVPTPPTYSLFGRLLAPFGPLVTDDFAETSGSAQTIMLQMWTVSREKMDPGELRELAESLVEIRETARQRVVQQQARLAASDAGDVSALSESDS